MEGLRALVTAVNFDVHGVPATVTLPASQADPIPEPITARVVWVDPTTEAVPGSGDYRRSDQRKVMAISRAEVPAVPRGTIVEAPEAEGDTPALWRVDSTEKLGIGRTLVVVVPHVV